MLKKTYLYLCVALPFLFSSLLKADKVAQLETEMKKTSDQIDDGSVEASMLAKKEAAESSAIEPNMKVPESELIEMVGYITALSGGVPMLELDDSGVASLTTGLVDGLTGDMRLEDVPQKFIQEAFLQAQARAEAIEAGSEEIPEIDEGALRTIGFVMANQSGLLQLGFGAEDADLIKKGFIKSANIKEPEPAMQAKMPAFQKFMQGRIAAAQARATAEANAISAKRIAAGKAFFEELAAEDSEVQKSESGLYYKILEPGTDEKPALEDSVLVHYKGTLIDGTQFDSSYDRGEPAEFRLGEVVQGFGEGLTKIGAGGKIILYIPSELGYGNSPRPGGPIKPGDALIFECELIDVNPE